MITQSEFDKKMTLSDIVVEVSYDNQINYEVSYNKRYDWIIHEVSYDVNTNKPNKKIN